MFGISFLIALMIYGSDSNQLKKPHIVLLIADDLGWNDVGFHGSNEIPTPNIDALAYNGVILNRHYTQNFCTPSRAALLTGKYPIRMGMQGLPFGNGHPVCLPPNEILLPQFLKKLGYVTRLIGKWHLGFYKKECTPTERGFDSFFGFYGGWVRYNDSVSKMGFSSGIDARNNFEPAGERFRGKYNTDVFTEEAVQVIRDHDITKPLFLDLSYAAVHAIWKDRLQVKNFEENEKKFAYIKDPNRRLFAGVLTALDNSVGEVIRVLDEKRMLNESIILFISDNGGETESGFFQNHASNWPLRGLKGFIFEGAVRGVAALWSPFTLHGFVLTNLMHLTDWLPTLLAAAGGGNISNIDGINQWHYLTRNDEKPPRSEVLVNINERWGNSALISDNWKFLINKNFSSRYSGSNGRSKDYKYKMSEIFLSPTHAAISKYNENFNEVDFQKCRNDAMIDRNCVARLNESEQYFKKDLPCFTTGCLFDLATDACEFTDLSESNPTQVIKMKKILSGFETKLIKQWNVSIDVKANPRNFNNYWSSWLK